MENALSEYKDWLEGEPNQSVMSAYQSAKKMLDERKQFEDNLVCLDFKNVEFEYISYPFQLESDPPSLDSYKEYLTFEENKGDVNRVSTLYERAIYDHPLSDELWKHYVAFLDRKLISGKVICDTYERAVRNIPWSAELWIKWGQALERTKQCSHATISSMVSQLTTFL